MKIDVAPLVGARIEIKMNYDELCAYLVAPLVGARIEIISIICMKLYLLSLPSWERGLKFCRLWEILDAERRSPRGSAD